MLWRGQGSGSPEEHCARGVPDTEEETQESAGNGISVRAEAGETYNQREPMARLAD